MKIRKQIVKGFTQISNTIAEDDRLSFKAKGLFLYMWHLPDDWNFYETEIAQHAKDGLSSVKSGIKELKKYSYLVIEQNRDSKSGRFGKYNWLLKEIPSAPAMATTLPKVDFPYAEKPMSENPHLLNTNNTNKHSTKACVKKPRKNEKKKSKNKQFIDKYGSIKPNSKVTKYFTKFFILTKSNRVRLNSLAKEYGSKLVLESIHTSRNKEFNTTPFNFISGVVSNKVKDAKKHPRRYNQRHYSNNYHHKGYNCKHRKGFMPRWYTHPKKDPKATSEQKKRIAYWTKKLKNQQRIRKQHERAWLDDNINTKQHSNMDQSAYRKLINKMFPKSNRTTNS